MNIPKNYMVSVAVLGHGESLQVLKYPVEAISESNAIEKAYFWAKNGGPDVKYDGDVEIRVVSIEEI